MLHKHTHLPFCVFTACGHWTLRHDCLLIYRPRSMLTHWGLVTPHGDKFLSSFIQVMAWHQFGARHCLSHIVNRGTLETNFREMILQIQIACAAKICWKILSVKQWPFCSGLDVKSTDADKRNVSAKFPLKQHIKLVVPNDSIDLDNGLGRVLTTYGPPFQPPFFQVYGKFV